MGIVNDITERGVALMKKKKYTNNEEQKQFLLLIIKQCKQKSALT